MIHQVESDLEFSTNHQEFTNKIVHGKRNLMVKRLKTMHAMKSMVTKTNVPVEEKVIYYIHVANFGARLAIFALDVI
jgi:hypothetical protein